MTTLALAQAPGSLNTIMSSLISSAHGTIEAYISAVNKTPLLTLGPADD